MKRTSVIILIVVISGCAHQPAPTTRPSVATTQPSYWLAQPAAAHIASADFDRLWSACEDAARGYGFVIDREDYRGGLVTTVPLVSKQWFEVWRNDVQTPEDLAASSLATFRRTLRFQITREPDGSYQATPMVIIERYAQAEHTITASVYLRQAFRSQRGRARTGSAEADRGIYLPQRYWYATGRDVVLERDVAKAATRRLKKT